MLIFNSSSLRHTLQTIRSIATNSTSGSLANSFNLVRLVGSITTEVYQSKTNNSRIFYLRTFNDDDFYDTHKIIVSAYAIEKLPAIPKTDQKILIGGKIRVQEFEQHDKKKRSILQIMANQIYLCDNDDELKNNDDAMTMPGFMNAMELSEPTNLDKLKKPTPFEIKDQNYVQLQAQICFGLQNLDKFSTFNLAFHYLQKDSNGNEKKQSQFVPVFVYNDFLRSLVRNQFNRLDYVRVGGELKYKACVDEDGKKYYRGYVLASKVAKLINLRDV